MNSYDLSRKFWDWAFDNPDKVKPIHGAIYFFAIEHCNRLGWKKKFGLPSQMVMEAIGVRNWRTYSKGLNELADFGFIEIVEKSKNQYSSNIVAIVNFTKAHTKALDKALQKHAQKQVKSTVSIDKQVNKEQGTSKGTSEVSTSAIDWKAFLKFFNDTTGKKHRTINEKTKRNWKAATNQGYTKDDLMAAVRNAATSDHHRDSNFKFLTPELITRPDKVDLWSNRGEVQPTREELMARGVI